MVHAPKTLGTRVGSSNILALCLDKIRELVLKAENSAIFLYQINIVNTDDIVVISRACLATEKNAID